MQTTLSWARWISNLYHDGHPSHRSYVLIKLLTDDLAKTLTTLTIAELDDRGHLGKVLDVGCGRGQFDFLVAIFNNVDSIVGVDLDERKIDVANAALERWYQSWADASDIRFFANDAMELDAEHYDSIFFFDVLNTLTESEQSEVLGNLASKLGEGGRLFLRESIKGEGPSLSKWLEPIGRWLGTNVGRDLRFPSDEELLELIEQAGLKVHREHRSSILKSRFLVLEKAE